MLYIALIFVLFVISIQIIYFLKTKDEIEQLESVFPDMDDSIRIVECSFVPSVINNLDLNSIVKNLPPKTDEKYDINGEEYLTISLLSISDDCRNQYPIFAEIIDKTNVYLCKNHGVSADLEIIKDICDQKINILENSIHNSLNIPLYCGLAGTFIGIIVGIIGIDLDTIFAAKTITANNFSSIDDLLIGIVLAMIASLFGLVLTVKNSTISFYFSSFREASKIVDGNKDIYFDFLRRELMPILAHSMASSLGSLRNVLGHFVEKFGTKLNDYADTAILLNENLGKQQEVLIAIEKINLVETSTRVANIFQTLKDSSNSLNVFYQYQQQLNDTISTVSTVISQINSTTNNIGQILNRFDTFAMGLNTVVEGQYKSAELQQQFRESIENHFPKGSEARDLWRKEFDLLMTDAQSLSKELSNQLTASTQYIQNFTTNNKEFFESFTHLREIITTLIQYADCQSQCYNDLRTEIIGLRNDFKGSKLESNELNRSTLEAIKTMNSLLQAIKKQ